MCQFICEKEVIPSGSAFKSYVFRQGVLIILMVELVYCNSVGGDRRASGNP